MTDPADADTEAEAEPATSSALLERLLPPVEQLDEDGQPKPSRMTPREQLVTVGLGCANIAIAGGAAATMERQQVPALLAGLLASALTLAGARVGNRMLAMLGLFACVVTRSSNTAVFVAFGLPFYAAALWIFFKYNRLQKAQAILRRQQRAEARGSTSRPSGSGRSSGSSGHSSGKAAKATPATKRPPASKRYTPPKPVKKRPPPPAKPPRDRSPVD